MGEVWRAHDTATDRVVAVKVLLPHFADDDVFQQRFRREAHAAAALQDPHVVPIHNYGEIDGRLYVDMRFIEGKDLHSLISEGGLDPTRSVHIIEQVAMALESAHNVGLIHRDIKPANVLVGKYDFAYLIDFGIAVTTGQTKLTNVGSAIGTWAYMAPERFGTGENDARSDVYSLACVLFECLTGRAPFPGTDAQQVIVAHLSEDPPRPSALRPGVPAAMDAVIAKGMAKEPAGRYQSAIALATAARAAVIPRTEPIQPPGPPPPPQARVAGPPSSAPPRGPSRVPAPPPRPAAGVPGPPRPTPPGTIRYPSAPFAGPPRPQQGPPGPPQPGPPPPTPGSRASIAPPPPQAPRLNLGTAALGLAVGSANLVAMRDGRPGVIRKPVVTLYPDRSAEVGVPGENPKLQQPGVALSSFVERVGDTVPIVAVDGSSHRAEVLLVEALDAMTRAVGGGAPVTIAVPSHWSQATIETLRSALHGRPGLSPERAPATVIPDAGAALAALAAEPGLPRNGVVVLCDLGATGTAITLADASAGMSIIGDTLRHKDFSGDFIDRTLLNYMLVAIAVESGDPAGTAAVESLTRLRDDCRRAKERLSTESATVVVAELPGGRTTEVRLTRSDLERLIEQQLNGLADAVDDDLLRHRVPVSSVSAIALVGGGAAIPVVNRRLSERLRATVVTTATPQFTNAAGAVIAAVNGLAPDAATGLNPAADDSTTFEPAVGGWASTTKPARAPVPSALQPPGPPSGPLASAPFPSGPLPSSAPPPPPPPPSDVATVFSQNAPASPYAASAPDTPETQKAQQAPAPEPALAWSQDDSADDEYTAVVMEPNGAPQYFAPDQPYPPEQYYPPGEYGAAAEPDEAAEAPRPRWYKRPPMLFGAAAAALLLTAGGIAAVTLTGDSTPLEPVIETVTDSPSTTPPKATKAPPPATTPKTTTPPPQPTTTKASPPVYTPPRTTRAPVTTATPPPTTEAPVTTEPPETTVQTEPTVPTVPTLPTLPTLTLPTLFPELTLPPLFPEAPGP